MMKNFILITLLCLLSISGMAQQNFDANTNKDKQPVQTISKEDTNRAKKEVKRQVSDKENKTNSIDKTKSVSKLKSKAELEALNKKVQVKKVQVKKNGLKVEKEKVVNEINVSDAKAKRKVLALEKNKATKEKNELVKENAKLSGKDFGEERARLAKENKEVKKKSLENTLSKAEIKYNTGKDKVKAVKEKLEADKAVGNITDSEYLEKMERIKKAEIALEKLKSNIAKSKQIQ